MYALSEYERRALAALPWIYGSMKAHILGTYISEVDVSVQGCAWVPVSWRVVGSGGNNPFYEQQVVLEYDDPLVGSISIFFKTAVDDTATDPTEQIRITGVHGHPKSSERKVGLDIVELRTLSAQWHCCPPVLNLDPVVDH